MFDADDPFDPLVRLRGRVEELAGDDLARCPAAALSERVLELAALRERVEAELVRSVGQWDAEQAWAVDGAVSAPGWLAARAAMTRPEAAGLVSRARLTRRYERVGKALEAGDISASHVATLAKAERHRSAVFADHEDVLVDLAPTLSPTEFVTALAHWRHAADDVQCRRDPYARFEHRYLELRHSFEGGAHVDGFLDPEAAAVFESALGAFSEAPDPAGTPGPARSAGQRRADALVELARAALEPAATDATTTIRRSLFAIDGVLDLSGARHELARHELDGRPAPRATLERLCCDTAISRVLMAGDSAVLDLGRRTRVPSAAQQRALRRRDRHCRFPGCDRPPQWSDAHHLVHWAHGGTTDLDNLVLLCRRHHVLCHEGHWQLRRQPDGVIATKPPDPDARWIHDTRAPPGSGADSG